MLRIRSLIISKACLLLLIVSQINSQNYEYDGEEDHENISEDDGEHYEHPDYSKYYSVDSSAPLVNQGKDSPPGGFVSPHEFDGFFGPAPIEFGASNNQQISKPQTLVPQQQPTGNIFGNPNQDNQSFQKDFFEESQRKQAAENQPEDNNDAPKYISYNHLPQKLRFDDEEGASTRSDEVEEVEPRENQKEDKEAEEIDDVKSFNYNKPSSTVSQYPSADGWVPVSPSPYQKYSFQSATNSPHPKYLESLITTIAPFNPNYKKQASKHTAPVYETQSSETVSKKAKNCRKIKKAINKEDSMNCYVCEDPSDKSKYTQCSYSSEPKPLNYYQGQSERYSTPSNGADGFRYKRYSDAEENDETDPYEYVKRRSQQQNTEDGEADFSKLFQYNPDFESESRSYSEKQSEEIKKNPKNCKKVDKDGMTCTICKDSETGGNYEQCSYTSEPKDKKYAYVTNKKYDSNDDDQPEEEESKTVEQKSKKIERPVEKEYGSKVAVEPTEEYEGKIKTNRRPERNNRFSKRRGEETRDNLKDDKHRETKQKRTRTRRLNKEGSKNEEYSVPKHFIEDTENQKDNNKEKFTGFDEEYHSKLYPETEESKREEQVEYTPTQSKHDVEDVLAEFSKKDRSKCKKAEKKGMTCYLCKDENNISHEECMYVSEPQNSHKAYHEVQKLNKPEEIEDGEESESRKSVKTTPAPVTKATIKRKRVFKKATTQKPTLEAAASEKFGSYVKYNPKKDKQLEKKEEIKEGLETQRVYSKVMGLNLPRYMVEKTEYEKDFDESSSFH
ncbi:unnamed protein product [Brassicogethes aeneus]|uniref:Uncharacterized protein n=1 Tax=Brassicogethes aeneus TaxID=1431903 RepID=A0A9P0ATF8_BRAAE|nr:unnamed protein product [Brassicogethes aeneus]